MTDYFELWRYGNSGSGTVATCGTCGIEVTPYGCGHAKLKGNIVEYRGAAPKITVGIKHDSEKPDWNLLPLKTLEPVVRVLMHGSKKYAPNNWQKVQPASRYFAAAIRHLTDHQAGIKADTETGESHLAHAMACLVFLMWHELSAEEAK